MDPIFVWTLIFVVGTFSLYIGIAVWSRVSSTAGFYVAGQGVPSVLNGMAVGADWMSAASFISMAGLIALNGFDGAIYLLGWTGGYVLLAILLAPYLRKFGKYTVPEFVGDRYYSRTARIVAAVCAVAVSLTYVAGQMRGVGIAFSRFLQVDITIGIVIGMVIVAIYATLGGMKGITYTQVAQYVVLMIAYAIPAIAIGTALTGNPVPQLAFGEVATRLNGIQEELGFGTYTSPFINISGLNVFLIALTLMCGTAGLPHVIVRFYTAKSVKGARWTGFWALVCIALLYTTAPAVAVFAKTNLIQSVNDVPINSLPAWTQTWGESDATLFAVDDKNNDGIAQYTNDDNNEVTISPDILVLANPEIAGLPAWVVGIVAAGGLAAALSTASGLLLVVGSAFSHDIYKRLIRPDASEQHELLVARGSVLVAVVIAGYFGINPGGYVAEVVAFAFGLAAASFFPVIVMGIFDKRANKEGAIAGMAVGLIFTGTYIVMCADRMLNIDPWLFGISAQGIGAVGMVISFIVMYVVSRATAEPPAEIQEFVEDIRYPRSASTAAAHD